MLASDHSMLCSHCRRIDARSTSTEATLPATNHVYVIHYRTRYGIKEGIREAVYRGLFDGWGKHKWQPLDGSPELYLFADEVLSIAENGEES
ncbi:MAG: hypothetical protein H0U59_05760 [Gemmatimonadaceae bacterium]|nr:hypothetical protein [Gemmatimonadaceae bacterium]